MAGKKKQGLFARIREKIEIMKALSPFKYYKCFDVNEPRKRLFFVDDFYLSQLLRCVDKTCKVVK